MKKTCIMLLGNRKDGSFTNVEVHWLCSWSFRQSVKIFLENVMIIDGIDFSVHNCIVSMQTYVWLDILFDVINVEEKQRWAKDRALGNSWCHVAPGWMWTVNGNSLDSVAQEVIYSCQGWSIIAIVREFHREVTMGNFINSLATIKKYYVNLTSTLDSCCPIMTRWD